MQTGLNQFISLLEVKGLLLRVKEFVDPNYEIAEITDRVCKRYNGEKAVLFENTGTGFPVLSNLNGSQEVLLEATKLLNVNDTISKIESIYKSLFEPRRSILYEVLNNLHLYKRLRFEPIYSSGRGECQQVVYLEPDLNILPFLTCWQFDAGKFLLNSLAHTQDPLTGRLSIEKSVLQVFSKNMAGIGFQVNSKLAKILSEYKNRGEHMPLAIVLGGSPLYSFASNFSLVESNKDYSFVGLLKGKGVKLVKGITVDVDLPCDADIIIEGYIDPQEELIWQGSYGTPSGYYSCPKWVPRFYVTCISHKDNAVFPSTIYALPSDKPMRSAFFLEQFLTLKIKKTIVPDVEDIHFPLPNESRGIAIVKIHKEYIGQVNKIANSLWGFDEMIETKVLVFVSDDIDIRNFLSVAEHVTQNYNPNVDTFFGVGISGNFNHSSDKDGIEGKILIDATRSLKKKKIKGIGNWNIDIEGVAEMLADNELLIDAFSTRLLNAGVSLLILSVDSSRGDTPRSIANKVIRKLNGSIPKFIVFVDKNIGVDNILLVTWFVVSNIDPRRDCFILEKEGENFSSLIVDGTKKMVKLGNILPQDSSIVWSSPLTISSINKKWIDLGIGEMIKSPSLIFAVEESCIS